MKRFVSLTAGAMLLAFAGAASAQDDQSVNVEGEAAERCTLPQTWTPLTTIGGATGTFTGTAWNIPQSSFSNANGSPLIGGELALRVTGVGFCNTGHTIQIKSANGGLRHSSLADAPAGFSSYRQVKYDAHWARPGTGTARRYGAGVIDWIPSGPGQRFSTAVPWNTAIGIPGERNFDVRLSVRRSDGSASTPLIGGNYSDTVTIIVTAT